MATKKLGTMSAEMRWLDRGSLALAFLTLLVVTFALRPESPIYLSFEAMIYLTFEALGGLLLCAMPAWMAHTWMRMPRPYHIIHIGLGDDVGLWAILRRDTLEANDPTGTRHVDSYPS